MVGNGTVGLRIQSSRPNVIVRNVTASGNGSNGIGIDTPQTGGGGEIVEDCTVFENAQIANDTSGLKTFSTGTVLRRNRVYDNGLGGVINHGIQLEVGSSLCQCYLNLCYGNLTAGISFTGADHLVAHNVCYDNGLYGISTFQASVTDCTVKNNLLIDNGTYSFRDESSTELSGLVLDYNLHEDDEGAAAVRYDGTDYANLAALATGESQEANGVEAGAGLNAQTLRVTTESSASGAGDAVEGITTDFNGTAFEDPPTIGAFVAQAVAAAGGPPPRRRLGLGLGLGRRRR